MDGIVNLTRGTGYTHVPARYSTPSRAVTAGFQQQCEAMPWCHALLSAYHRLSNQSTPGKKTTNARPWDSRVFRYLPGQAISRNRDCMPCCHNRHTAGSQRARLWDSRIFRWIDRCLGDPESDELQNRPKFIRVDFFGRRGRAIGVLLRLDEEPGACIIFFFLHFLL